MDPLRQLTLRWFVPDELQADGESCRQALRTVVFGLAMLFFPAATLELFRWNYDGPMFFPSQTGVFLTLLGGGYLAALRHRPFIWLILISKATAVVFLVSEHFILGPDGPITVLAAGVGDAIMGISLAAVLILNNHRAARRQSGPGGKH